jgi:hypothetical protein
MSRGAATSWRRIVAPVAAGSLLAGCATIRVKPEAERVAIHFTDEPVRGCTYLGEVVGSEGHWYSAWLIANERLTESALNDLRNKAHAKGADAVYVPSLSLLFRSSVTILGQAYGCRR